MTMNVSNLERLLAARSLSLIVKDLVYRVQLINGNDERSRWLRAKIHRTIDGILDEMHELVEGIA